PRLRAAASAETPGATPTAATATPTSAAAGSHAAYVGARREDRGEGRGHAEIRAAAADVPTARARGAAEEADAHAATRRQQGAREPRPFEQRRARGRTGARARKAGTTRSTVPFHPIALAARRHRRARHGG